MAEKLPSYGGQAVMEGVMMRGSRAVAIAMRAPDKEIVIHEEVLGGLYKSQWAKIPFLRGLVMLWDALALGMRGLMISANIQTGEDEKLEGPALYLTMGFSFALGIGLFFLLPAFIGHLFQWGATALDPTPSTDIPSWMNWVSNLLEGLVRLGLLVGYIWAIRHMPEIMRVFAYHGAEHKTINAYESGADLTPEVVTRFPLEHPRCGTSFLLTLVLLSILLYSLLGPMPLGWKLASRVLTIPVLASLAYEYIRWTARHLETPLVRFLIRPNLALQHLTTAEPSMDMLEVSIAAFKAMYEGEARLLEKDRLVGEVRLEDEIRP